MVLVLSPNGTYARLATLEDARTAAFVAGKTVVVTTALTEAQSNILGPWPTDRTLEVKTGGEIKNTTAFTTTGALVMSGGKFGVTSTGAITINGPFSAGLYQVFSGSGAVTGLKEAKPAWWGVYGDGTVQTVGMNALAAQAQAGVPLFLPKGDYRTATPWTFTNPVNITGETGTCISLTVSGAYVVKIDGSGGTPAWLYNSSIHNVILDGRGFATDGLLLVNVISSEFSKVQATNITRAGFHLAWAQLCTFTDIAVSENIEAYTTTPVNGILVDTSASSANTFINATVEHVSGSGILLKSAINSQFIGGTSEGNDIGIEFGEAVSSGQVAIFNTVVGMDIEVNTTSDIVLRATASGNNFQGIQAGYESSVIYVQGSYDNTFFGGYVGGFDFDTLSHDNLVSGVKIMGAGRTIIDLGTNNVKHNVFNHTDRIYIPNTETARINHVGPVGTVIHINASLGSYHNVTLVGTSIIIDDPTSPVDGQELDITFYNESGGAAAVLWPGSFKFDGWTDPANGKNRSMRLRYNLGRLNWYAISMSQVDVPN